MCVSVEIEFLFFSCNIHTISFWNSFHFRVKDVTEIVSLLILILKLIAKFRECIRYFRRRGWQQDGGDGTTNNKMGIESDYSIVAPVKASTYAGNGVHHANRHSTLSHYYLEFHAFFLLLLLRLSSIRKHGDWWGVFFFWQRYKFFLGPLSYSCRCSTMGPRWLDFVPSLLSLPFLLCTVFPK